MSNAEVSGIGRIFLARALVELDGFDIAVVLLMLAVEEEAIVEFPDENIEVEEAAEVFTSFPLGRLKQDFRELCCCEEGSTHSILSLNVSSSSNESFIIIASPSSSR